MSTLFTDNSLGPADSLDDGKYVLLKKSEDPEGDYSVANKPRRRSKKDRKKLSVVGIEPFFLNIALNCSPLTSYKHLRKKNAIH